MVIGFLLRKWRCRYLPILDLKHYFCFELKKSDMMNDKEEWRRRGYSMPLVVVATIINKEGEGRSFTTVPIEVITYYGW